MFNDLVKDLNLIHILCLSGSKIWLIRKVKLRTNFSVVGRA